MVGVRNHLRARGVLHSGVCIGSRLVGCGGSANAIIALFIGFVIAAPVLGFTFMPLGLYVAQVSAVPDEWRKDRSRRARLGSTLAWLIAAGLFAILIGWVVSTGTAFIADLNPCEAFKAGVTGTRMPGPGCV
jgi:hypothetical protein